MSPGVSMRHTCHRGRSAAIASVRAVVAAWRCLGSCRAVTSTLRGVEGCRMDGQQGLCGNGRTCRGQATPPTIISTASGARA
ncbi:hypothetical protein F751_0243 [Auxenochlorella protothecoides]|uniref:Uncharacterized protein n=1 Tax=Auxenochlorella protothecoides TaxID=3075 RepID=A0A087SEA5_AUXPR|nr:hypothetical protein F751_0243 [Auxenochlorella protothecoides]KFM24059.1 hypothetical protein F751_0243 [Auxenochlorella protothecoides]